MTKNQIEALTKSMRRNMKDALNSLKTDAADEFFDSLFEASEDIIHLSSLLRDPKIDEKALKPLMKAVTNLGRNNAGLIQDFNDMCSFIHRSPRPRKTMNE